jgi:hypothetical protein
MKVSKTKKVDVIIDESNLSPMNTTEKNNSNASARLDRRRRIEDIDEERRLREELSEF